MGETRVLPVSIPCQPRQVSPMAKSLINCYVKYNTDTVPHCSNSECPPFSVDDKTDTYEVRTYDSGRWAVVNVTDTKYE
jgi:hypothetical protein